MREGGKGKLTGAVSGEKLFNTCYTGSLLFLPRMVMATVFEQLLSHCKREATCSTYTFSTKWENKEFLWFYLSEFCWSGMRKMMTYMSTTIAGPSGAIALESYSLKTFHCIFESWPKLMYLRCLTTPLAGKCRFGIAQEMFCMKCIAQECWHLLD